MRADTIPTPSVSPALTVQGRVIAALILREIHTLYGNTRLGYLWAIIQTAFGIGVFWAFREVMGAHAPHGMGMAVFLLCGFIPWYIFSDTISRCMKAVSANQALLTFPAGDGAGPHAGPYCGGLGDAGSVRRRYSVRCRRLWATRGIAHARISGLHALLRAAVGS